MDSGKRILHYLIRLGVIVLQLIMTQVVTFLASLLIPNTENFPLENPALFVIFLGITFTIGVFLIGWLALKLHWLNTKPKYAARLVATLIGAYLPLILALILYHPLEPGNPFFLISILASILGFYIPGLIETQ
jgi:formate-dependent nitrite reductase membrane component NrfD